MLAGTTKPKHGSVPGVFVFPNYPFLFILFIFFFDGGGWGYDIEEALRLDAADLSGIH